MVQGFLLKWMLILSCLVFINTGQPPESSHLPIPFKERNEWKPSISGFEDIAPIHSSAAAVPSALAQPPVSPDVSSKSSHPPPPTLSFMILCELWKLEPEADKYNDVVAYFLFLQIAVNKTWC